MTQLYFSQTHSFQYPTPTSGGNTALAFMQIEFDVMLAFLTQTPYDDEVVIVSTTTGNEYFRYVSPLGRDVIAGMHGDESGKVIWCNQGTNTLAPGDDRETVFFMSSLDGSERGRITIAPSANMVSLGGLAVHRGNLFIAGGPQSATVAPFGTTTIQQYTKTGLLQDSRDFPNQSIGGLSTSHWGVIER